MTRFGWFRIRQTWATYTYLAKTIRVLPYRGQSWDRGVANGPSLRWRGHSFGPGGAGPPESQMLTVAWYGRCQTMTMYVSWEAWGVRPWGKNILATWAWARPNNPSPKNLEGTNISARVCVLGATTTTAIFGGTWQWGSWSVKNVSGGNIFGECDLYALALLLW